MTNNFTYCILSYVHSQLLDERVNVGILFHFENTNQFIFKKPKKFKRLKDLYEDFSEWQLRSNLNAIEEKIFELNDKINSLFNSDSLLSIKDRIDKNILREDSTVLQFSELKFSANTSPNTDAIISNYFNLYFSGYNEEEIAREKHDENYLSSSFRQKLFSKNPDVQHRIYRNFIIKAPDTSIEFDYKWKNGVDNFVKPVAFDLETEDTINHKAILLSAQLDILKDKIDGNKIDLLVSAPSIRKRGLKDAYNIGLKILKKSTTKPTIYEEDEIEKYVEIVAKNAKAPPVN